MPKGPHSTRRSGKKQAAEEKCTEDRKTQELHAFATCLWLKIHPHRFLGDPLVAVLTLALLSWRPCSFLAPSIGHIDSDGDGGRGKNLFLQF